MHAVLAVALLVLTLAGCGTAATSSARRAGWAPVMPDAPAISDAAFAWCQENYAVVEAGLELGVLHNPMRAGESELIDAIFAERAVAIENAGFVLACNAAFDHRER